MNEQTLYIKDTKFKTSAICVNFYRKLSRSEVTYNSLLPSVLKSGCGKIPHTKELNTYLEELYGAKLSIDVKKCGDIQIISFFISTVADTFAENDKPFEKSLELIKEIIYSPFVTENDFSKEYVDTEKRNLKELIESVKNDKREYSKKRLIEEMYSDETYGIFEYGYTEDLEDINEKNLYEYYKNFIKTTKSRIIVCGNFDKDKVEEKIDEIFPKSPIGEVLPEISFGKYKNEPKYISEVADVTQGKLTIGYRANTTKDSKNYFAMLVLNNLFGGAPHSKLFLNVREKLSLAYYASSGYNSFKGLVIVSCGIEFDKYQVTLDEVNKQLENIKNAYVTDEEIAYSKSALITGYKAINDSVGSLISFYTSQSVGNKSYSINDFIQGINNVTKEEIVNVAKGIKLDTVYFLKGGDC